MLVCSQCGRFLLHAEDCGYAPDSGEVEASVLVERLVLHLGEHGSLAGGVWLGRRQLEEWAGRPLTGDDLARLATAISNSSVPDAISSIVDGFDQRR